LMGILTGILMGRFAFDTSIIAHFMHDRKYYLAHQQPFTPARLPCRQE
jgi:hypothetical protein